MLLLPTSSQNVQVGPVSKSRLSWHSDPKWLFHFTCQLQVLRCRILYHLSPLPYFLTCLPLFSSITSLQLWWAPGCFSDLPGLLLPSSPVLDLSSLPALLLPGFFWLTPSPPLRFCSNVTSTYLSLPWPPFKKFNLSPLHLDILNLNLPFLPPLNCHNTAILHTV